MSWPAAATAGRTSRGRGAAISKRAVLDKAVLLRARLDKARLDSNRPDHSDEPNAPEEPIRGTSAPEDWDADHAPDKAFSRLDRVTTWLDPSAPGPASRWLLKPPVIGAAAEPSPREELDQTLAWAVSCQSQPRRR